MGGTYSRLGAQNYFIGGWGGRLLTFPTERVGAYSRWVLIRGWALNRINTVYGFVDYSGFEKVMES